MQPGLDMDMELLPSLAQSVTETSLTLRAEVSAAGSQLAPPPQPGSAAAAARVAERAWLAELGRLQRDITAFGENLGAAARDHEATDEANAAGLRAAGSGAPR